MKAKAGADIVIASQFVPVALMYGAAGGMDTSAIRRELSLPETLAATVQLPLSVIASIAEKIAVGLGDPHYALTLAERVPRGIGGVGELAARTAPTVGAAMDRISRFARIIPPHQNLTWSRGAGELRWEYSVPLASPPFAGRHTNEYVVAAFYRLMRELVGAKLETKRVWFAHGPVSPRAYATHFGTREVAFDCESDGIAFDESVADLPVVTADAAMHDVLERYAASLLPAAAPTQDRLHDVEKAVAELLVDGVPSLATIAKRLGLSPRTLQRRLQDEKTTFGDLVDRIRSAAARQHLQGSRLSVSEIAYVLGYSDGRAFARAFERWTGTTPTGFRAHAGAHDPE
jgi:AraC-like DNA-binding protein